MMRRDVLHWMMILLLLACRREAPETTDSQPTQQAAPRIPREQRVQCRRVALVVKAEGTALPAGEVDGSFIAELETHGVAVADGVKDRIRLVYLFEPGSGSFGVQAEWRAEAGPLRRRFQAGEVREIPPQGPARASAVQAALAPVARSLALQCGLESASEQELPSLLEVAQTPYGRIAWSRACGDRSVAGCRPGLLKVLGDDQIRVAAAAAVALGQLGSAQDAAALVERARRADPLLVRAVVLALDAMDDEQARRYLRDWAANHPDPSVQELAKELLAD